MKHLFIGGIADGAIYDIDKEQDIVRVPLPKQKYVTPEDSIEAQLSIFPYEKYQRMYLVSRQHKEYSVFCAINEDIDIIERLIEGYRRP